MTRSALVAALAYLASGCASSQPTVPEPEGLLDRRAQALEQSVAETAAKEGGAVARRTALEVAGVEDMGENLVFDLRIVRSASFGRPEREFTVVTRCPAATPQVCHDKAMAALRTAVKTD
ncbi:MAG TPA: hypothetical protein VD906_16190 [Caulobacteraceae bacterium]|nr:hypothetical protein [Caulobacteraceae bacterium]